MLLSAWFCLCVFHINVWFHLELRKPRVVYDRQAQDSLLLLLRHEMWSCKSSASGQLKWASRPRAYYLQWMLLVRISSAPLWNSVAELSSQKQSRCWVRAFILNLRHSFVLSAEKGIECGTRGGGKWSWQHSQKQFNSWEFGFLHPSVLFFLSCYLCKN